MGDTENADDTVRAALVDELRLLREFDSPQLKAVSELAALVCGAPVGAVSLLDADRLQFVGRHNLPMHDTEARGSFCDLTAADPTRTLLLPDLTLDPRFRQHPSVVDLHVRSYAGVPLVLSDGVAVGALCVMDVVPRELSASQVVALELLAETTVALLRSHATTRRLQTTLDTLDETRTAEALSRDQFTAVFERAPLGLTVVQSDGIVLRANHAFASLLGHTPDELVGRHVWDITAKDDLADELERMTDLREGRATASVREKRYLHADGHPVPTIATTSLVHTEDGSSYVVLNQVESLAVRRAAETRMLEVQSAVDGIISIDGGGRVTSWNLGAQRLFGHSAKDMLGRTLEVIMPVELRGPHTAGVQRLAAGGAERLIGRSIELPAVRADGRSLEVELTLSSWGDHGKIGFTAVVRDISERRAAQVRSELVAVAARAANDAETFEQAAGPVLDDACARLGWVAARAWKFGTDRAVWSVNSHAHADEQPCGLVPLAARGSHPLRKFAGDGKARISMAEDSNGLGRSDLAPVLAGCRVQAGVVVPVLSRGLVAGGFAFYVPQDAELPAPELVATLEQIGVLLGRVVEREAAAELLRQQALYDSLTGLANRRLLLERVSHVQTGLAQGTAEGTPAVVIFDLDRFKLVNDSLGHAAGDLVLGEVTSRLLALTGPQDTVARLGGDEFVVLAHDVGSGETDPVRAYAQRLLDGVRGPLRVVGHELAVRLSAGACAITAEHAANPQLPATVLRDADAALLLAKRRGKDRLEVYGAGLRDDAVSRLDDENALSNAIADGELTLHYQPVVDLATGQVHGAEALVRWPRPGHGLVPPDRFIPLAEETGLIVELGLWVLDRACRDAASWSSTVPAMADCPVSVNVSTRQLSHPRFLADVDRVLQASGLPSSRLTIEITESALVERDSPALDTLHALHERGIRLALDDFGTGYSSLSYVQRLPVDVVKIDKSFVDLITGPGEGTAFTEVVLKLAEAMDLETTAEGVETPEQAEVLRLLGCHHGQGWTWSRAVPLELLSDAVARLAVGAPAAPVSGGAASSR